MIKRIFALLPMAIKRTKQFHPMVKVSLDAHVSFSTHFQIWFRNAQNEPTIKEITGKDFSISFLMQEKDTRVELLAFVHNPKQIEGQSITLSISFRGEKTITSTFDIESHRHHSGWHRISADFLKPETIYLDYE
jgi:hypothetical protein